MKSGNAAWIGNRRRMRLGGGLLACVLTLLLGAGVASANVPFQSINSNGPIDQIVIGNDLSCQAHFKGDALHSFFPPITAPGDCGTFLASSADGVVYAPNFANHDGTATSNADIPLWTPFTPVSQSGVTGNGSSSNPFKVVTTVAAGAVQIKQTTTYVEGKRSFRNKTEFANGGPPQLVVLYRAVDCYLAESDDGFGALNPATGGVYCALNPNNSPAGRVIGFTPLTPGSNYIESHYTTVWSSINGAPFPNTVDGDTFQDNGTGISWTFNLPSGGSLRATSSQAAAVYSDDEAIDPRGFAPAKCGGKNATIIGTDLADKLRGTKKKDVIAGLGGKDRIKGLGGKDILCGGGGKDVLRGGGGKDKLIGGAKKDRCIGGGGKDKAKSCERKKSI